MDRIKQIGARINPGTVASHLSAWILILALTLTQILPASVWADTRDFGKRPTLRPEGVAGKAKAGLEEALSGLEEPARASLKRVFGVPDGGDLFKALHWPAKVLAELQRTPEDIRADVGALEETWRKRAETAGVDSRDPEALDRFYSQEVVPWVIVMAAGEATRVSETGLDNKVTLRPAGQETVLAQARKAVQWRPDQEHVVVIDAKVAYRLLREGQVVGQEKREAIKRGVLEELKDQAADLRETAKRSKPADGPFYSEAAEKLSRAANDIGNLVLTGWKVAWHERQQEDAASVLRRLEQKLMETLPDTDQGRGLAHYVWGYLAARFMRELVEEPAAGSPHETFVDPERVEDVAGPGKIILAIAPPNGPGGAFQAGIERLKRLGRLDEHRLVMPVYGDYGTAGDTGKYPDVYLYGIVKSQANAADPPRLPRVAAASKAPLSTTPKGKGIFWFGEDGTRGIAEWRELAKDPKELEKKQLAALERYGASLWDFGFIAGEKEFPEKVKGWSGTGKTDLNSVEQSAVIRGWRDRKAELGNNVPEKRIPHHGDNAGVFVMAAEEVLAQIGRGLWNRYGKYDHPDPKKGKLHEFWYTDCVEEAGPNASLVFAVGGDTAPAGIKDPKRVAASRAEQLKGTSPGAAQTANLLPPGAVLLDEQDVDWLRSAPDPKNGKFLGQVMAAEGAKIYLYSRTRDLGDREERRKALHEIFGIAGGGSGQDMVWILEGVTMLEDTARIGKGATLNDPSAVHPTILEGDTVIGQGRSVASAALDNVTLLDIPELDGFSYPAHAPRKGRLPDVWNKDLADMSIPPYEKAQTTDAASLEEGGDPLEVKALTGPLVRRAYLDLDHTLADVTDGPVEEETLQVLGEWLKSHPDNRVTVLSSRANQTIAARMDRTRLAQIAGITHPEEVETRVRFAGRNGSAYLGDVVQGRMRGLPVGLVTLDGLAGTLRRLVREMGENLDSIQQPGFTPEARGQVRQAILAMSESPTEQVKPDYEVIRKNPDVSGVKIRHPPGEQHPDLGIYSVVDGSYIIITVYGLRNADKTAKQADEKKFDPRPFLMAGLSRRYPGYVFTESAFGTINMTLLSKWPLLDKEMQDHLEAGGAAEEFLFADDEGSAAGTGREALEKIAAMGGVGLLVGDPPPAGEKLPEGVTQSRVRRGPEALKRFFAIQTARQKGLPVSSPEVSAGLEEIQKRSDLIRLAWKGERTDLSVDEIKEQENFKALADILGDEDQALQWIKIRARDLGLTPGEYLHGLLHPKTIAKFLEKAAPAETDGEKAALIEKYWKGSFGSAERFVLQERAREAYDAFVVGGGSSSDLAARAFSGKGYWVAAVTVGSDNGGLTQKQVEDLESVYGVTYPSGDPTAALGGFLQPLSRGVWQKRDLKQEITLEGHVRDAVREVLKRNVDWYSKSPDLLEFAIEMLNLSRIAKEKIVPHRKTDLSIRHEAFAALMAEVGAYDSIRKKINPVRFEVGSYLLERALGIQGRVLPNSVDKQTLYARWANEKEKTVGQVAISLKHDSDKQKGLPEGEVAKIDDFGFMELVSAYPGLLLAIDRLKPGAVVHLGPSSAVVSRSPQLAIREIANALADRVDVGKVWWMNVTWNNETLRWSAMDEVKFWEMITGRPIHEMVQYVVVNNEWPIEQALAAAKTLAEKAGSYPAALDWMKKPSQKEVAEAIELLRRGTHKKLAESFSKRQLLLALGFSDWGDNDNGWKFRGGRKLTEEEREKLRQQGLHLLEQPIVDFVETAMRLGYGNDRKAVKFPVPVHDPVKFAQVDQNVRNHLKSELSSAGLEEKKAVQVWSEDPLRFDPADFLEGLRRILSEGPQRMTEGVSGVRFRLNGDASPAHPRVLDLYKLAQTEGYLYARNTFKQLGEKEKKEIRSKRIPLTFVAARDTRPGSLRIMEHLTRGLLAAGESLNIKVRIVSLEVAPKPILMKAVEVFKAHGGVNATASHNPVGTFGDEPEYVGWEFSQGHLRGGELLIRPQMLELTQSVRSLVGSDEDEKAQRQRTDLMDGLWATHESSDEVQLINLLSLQAGERREEALGAYRDHLRVSVGDGAKGAQVVFDANGSAAGFRPEMGETAPRETGLYAEVMERLGVVVHEINPDQVAHPAGPEKAQGGLRALSRKVQETGADFGFSTDPDADRFGLVVGRGRDKKPMDLSAQESATLVLTLGLARAIRLDPQRGSDQMYPYYIVVNESSSSRIREIARLISRHYEVPIEVIEVETGEANVVSRMRAIRETLSKEDRQGTVFGVEASHSGVLWPGSHCYDACLSALKLASFLKEKELLEEVARILGAARPEEDFPLAKLARLMPGEKRLSRRFSRWTTPAESPEGKIALQPEMMAPVALFRTKGKLIEAAYRRWPTARVVITLGDRSREAPDAEGAFAALKELSPGSAGGLKILFSGKDGRERFLVFRLSGTTPSTLRIIADAASRQELARLQKLGRQMFEEASKSALSAGLEERPTTTTSDMPTAWVDVDAEEGTAEISATVPTVTVPPLDKSKILILGPEALSLLKILPSIQTGDGRPIPLAAVARDAGQQAEVERQAKEMGIAFVKPVVNGAEFKGGPGAAVADLQINYLIQGLDPLAVYSTGALLEAASYLGVPEPEAFVRAAEGLLDREIELFY